MWMPGAEMFYVSRELEHNHGFSCALFGYPSLTGSLDDNAALLLDFIAEHGQPTVHLVGHSLGGVIALRALSLEPQTAAGRVVCLGSPLSGSKPAGNLQRSDWGRALLGKALIEGVLEKDARSWASGVTESREVGSIAGTVSMGMGRWFAAFEENNDGTVAVSETQMPGLADHLCLPVSHSGMVLSSAVVTQVAAFLKNGRFDPE
jgi:pimeloyl-ACP methyl ester carboxylesterase